MYGRILVGTDGSKTAAIAVDRAAEVAKATGARLTVMTVGKGEKAERVVTEAAARVGQSGVVADIKISDGDPASALVSEADEGNYDLLVVGNKGMQGASRLMLRNVPNKVSHLTRCALLIVRTT
ncbi:MAG TPA: universal stress protein [Acidimicrobiales bacterium]|nr:universal stress protein [Acidimicrobiales bacterium]